MTQRLSRDKIATLLSNSLQDPDDRRNLARWAILEGPFDALMAACLHYGATIQKSGSLSTYAYVMCMDLMYPGVPTMSKLAKRAYEYNLPCIQRPTRSQRPTMLEFRSRDACRALVRRYEGSPAFYVNGADLGRQQAFDAWVVCLEAAKRGTPLGQRQAALAKLREAQDSQPNLSLPAFVLAYAQHKLDQMNADPAAMEL